MTLSITYSDWATNEAKYGTITVFFQGCDFSCEGCQNPELREHKTLPSFEVARQKIQGMLDITPIKHIVLSGGDPLSKMNLPLSKKIVNEFHEKAKIMVYTGVDSQNLEMDILNKVHFIKCGRFIQSLKQESGHFGDNFQVASTNQVLMEGKTGKILSKNGVFNKKEYTHV